MSLTYVPLTLSRLVHSLIPAPDDCAEVTVGGGSEQPGGEERRVIVLPPFRPRLYQQRLSLSYYLSTLRRSVSFMFRGAKSKMAARSQESIAGGKTFSFFFLVHI